VPRLGYRVGLPKDGAYQEIMNSDWQQYGGSGVSNGGQIVADHMAWQHCDYSATLNLPPLGVFMLKPVG
jgi:1,4-alpha-glucan branching enzyme